MIVGTVIRTDGLTMSEWANQQIISNPNQYPRYIINKPSNNNSILK